MNGKTILLDSNFIINLLNGKVDYLFESTMTYAVSVITKMGLLGYPFRSTHEEEICQLFFRDFVTLFLDDEIANEIINLRKLRKIKLPDAIICATALIHDMILFTNDLQLRTIDNLQTESFTFH